MSRSPPGQSLPGWDGEGTLHCYLLDYLNKRNYTKAARAFAEESGMLTDAAVPIDAPQGLLFEWWSVFWDVFLAHTGKANNRYASVYVNAGAVKNGVAPRSGPPPQMAPSTPQTMSQPLAFSQNAPPRPQSINGQPAQNPMGHGPPPAQRTRMTPQQYNQQLMQQQHLAQQHAAAAAAQHQAAQQQQQANPIQRPQSVVQQQQQQMMHQPSPYTGMPPTATPPRQDAPMSREFLNECMSICGLGGRDIDGLSDAESVHLTNFIRQAQNQQAQQQAQHTARVQAQQAAAHQAQAHAAMYAQPAATPNGAYYYQPASPAPQAVATPVPYQGSPPPSAPAMQTHFSQPPIPSSTGGGRRGGRPAVAQQSSAPPTPELASASVGNGPATTASPRGRKRPRMDPPPPNTHQPPPQPQAHTPSPFDPYMAASAVPRPSSAASGRGATASSPHMPPQYAMQHGSMSEDDATRQQHGINGLSNKSVMDRKRSPMAPPPLPLSHSSSGSTHADDIMGVSTSRPNSSEMVESPMAISAAGMSHASPAPNGIVTSAPGSAQRPGPATSGAGSYYGLTSGGSGANGEEEGTVSAGSNDGGLFDHQPGSVDFGLSELGDLNFDMSAYINVGDEFGAAA